MTRVVIESFACGDDNKLQKDWKHYHMTVLQSIKEKGYYTPPQRVHPLRRWFLCQRHTLDYIVFTNLTYNSPYIKPETYKEICTAYVSAFDEYRKTSPIKSILIRNHLIDLLNMYVKSCVSLTELEPQRSIVHTIQAK